MPTVETSRNFFLNKIMKSEHRKCHRVQSIIIIIKGSSVCSNFININNINNSSSSSNSNNNISTSRKLKVEISSLQVSICKNIYLYQSLWSYKKFTKIIRNQILIFAEFRRVQKSDKNKK